VIAVWVVLVAVGGILSSTWLTDALTSDIVIERNVESISGLARLNDSGLEDVAPLTETIVIWSTTGLTIDDAAFADRAQAVTDRVREIQAGWAEEDGIPVNMAAAALNGVGDYPPVYSYVELARLGLPQAESLVAGNRESTVVIVGLPSVGESGARMHAFYKEIDALSGDGIEVATIGQLTFQERFSEIAEQDLVRGESIGIPMALVVLVAVFGALLAPVLPLVLGVSSIAVALGAVAILGQFNEQQLFIQNMITMLGLAVGIDYALFVVERFREERRAGFTVQRAIERAGATSSKAVVFSGATVVLSLAGVMLVPTNIFRSLGLGAILVVVVSVLASLTLLPAMLALIGDRINWPRQRLAPDPSAIARMHDPYAGFWGKLTHIVMARPIVSVVLAAGVLLGAAIPALDMHTGVESLDSLPPGQARDGYQGLLDNYPAGITAPVQFVIGGEHEAAQQAVTNLQSTIAESGLFVSPIGEPGWSEDGQTAAFTAILQAKPDSDAAFETIRMLRSELVPESIGDMPGVEIWVTGSIAANLDFTDIVSDHTPWVFVFVLSLSFILLMLAFRSIVVPIKAILLNLLSVGATWGLMVLVFQKGVLADFFGFQQTPIIQIWIPILLFAVLFGLSMDYHVFLLSRIREHFDTSGNNRESVAVGLHATARIITGAAMIMVVVFGGFASGSLVALQQLGFGLAVAVFLDATIVRSVLVPATMVLLGERNWYLPRWLQWLPDLRVEGHVEDGEAHPTS
jgi:RND superfamily putative drug exporter